MSLEMQITFNMESGTYSIEGNVKKSGYVEVLEGFIRNQMGAGEDHSKPIPRKEYHIQLRLDLSDDTYSIKSDAGNKGLTLGILMDVFSQLQKTSK